MSVQDGRIVLPDGMSYRMLVLPQVEAMTPKLLRKIRDLVQAGGTVLGWPPSRSPSLEGYPKCDDVVKTLVVNGYGREQEKDADSAALGYLAAAGYDPQGLTGYLKRLEQGGRGSKSGIFTTHPGTDERLENVRQASVPAVDTSAVPKRTKRFVDMTR